MLSQAKMTDQEFGILAYTKSPKTSKRTTFQDELQAAVSARASKVMMDQYSDDFDDDEGGFLKDLKSRKKKINAFKTSKAKMVNFEFSDDEDKPAKTKRVSFLKTQRIDSFLENSPTQPFLSHAVDDSGDQSLLPSKCFNTSDGSSDKRSDEESVHFQDPQEESTQKSSTPVSEGALLDTPPPLPSHPQNDTLDSHSPNDTSTHSKPLTEKTVPTPKPRQRVIAVTNNPQDKLSASQDLNIPLALISQPSNQCTNSSYGSNQSEGTRDANSRSQSLSSMGGHSVLTKSTSDSGSNNEPNAEDTEDHVLSLVELTLSQPPDKMQESVDQIDCPTNLNSHMSDNSSDTLTSVSHPKGPPKVSGWSAKVVESRYLGSLRVLDQGVSDQNAESPADSLRAAVYQEWLKKKKEHLKEKLEMKKKEDIIEEKKKKDQEAKREDSIASYNAWKDKKSESLKMKIKEQQEKTRKVERAKEEREEKRLAAKQVFEKWKDEHDLLLKERCRKARKDETERKLQKEEKETERKRSNNSAFFEWSEKKKNILHEKSIAKQKELEDNAQTEHYLKEEKDKMAVDMYESWLAKKNLEKKRQKEQKWLQGILHDSPPPPWSPPNKTIPYRK